MEDGLLDDRIWRELVADCGLDPCERPQVHWRTSHVYIHKCHLVAHLSVGVILSLPAIAARCPQLTATLQATLFHQLGMTKADFTKLVTSRRSNGLLQLRVPTIKNKLHFLRDEIGLNNEEVRKLLVKCPRILEHKLESNMRPHLEFLRSHGISKEDISKVLSAAS